MMSLRIEPLPRMAGHLPFMRGRIANIDDLSPGMVAAFGLSSGSNSHRDLAALALRETSAYFGSHFNANMKTAMDIDQRQPLNSAALAGSIVDLGDLSAHVATGNLNAAIRTAVDQICRRGAIPIMLGGDQKHLVAAREGLRDAHAETFNSVALVLISAAPHAELVGTSDITCTLPHQREKEIDHHQGLHLTFTDLRQNFECWIDRMMRHLGINPVHVALDASSIASHWHASHMDADFHGLSLSECRSLLRQLGRANISSLSITGLDPTINGLSLVKTGQRLLLTAILDLIYARLDVLGPRMELRP